MILLLRQLVAGNVELERAAERDVQNLHAFANRENRQTAAEDFFDRIEFPAVSFWIDILLQHIWIDNFLPKKFRRDVRPAGQEESIHLFERDFFFARIV